MFADDFDTRNPVARAVALAEAQAVHVADGQERAAYFSGPPGVGKTRIIHKAIARKKRTGAKPLFVNPERYQDVVDAFKQAGPTGRLIVFEEADAMFESTRQVNILKQATAERSAEWVYNGIRLDAPILVAANLDLGNPKLWRAPMRAHLAALFNRVAPVVIPDDPHALWEYSVQLALNHGLLSNTAQGNGIRLRVKLDALQWFTANKDNLITVSPRTLRRIATYMSAMEGGELSMHLEALLQPGAEVSRQSPFYDWEALLLQRAAPRRRGGRQSGDLRLPLFTRAI
jgi:hypothetical protein